MGIKDMAGRHGRVGNARHDQADAGMASCKAVARAIVEMSNGIDNVRA